MPEPLPPRPPAPAPDARAEMRRLSRRAFTVGGLAALAGAGGWWWLGAQEEDERLPWPLRRVLDGNGWLAQRYYSPEHLAPTFPPERAREPRVNGLVGMMDPVDHARWEVQVSHTDQRDSGRSFR